MASEQEMMSSWGRPEDASAWDIQRVKNMVALSEEQYKQLEQQLAQARTLLAEVMDIELRVEAENGQHRLVFADEKAAGRFVRVALQANALLKLPKEPSE